MLKKPKRDPTVAIFQSIYSKAKARADARGITLINYVNEILLLNIEKDDFLKKYAPYIETVAVGDTIVLRDHKVNKLAEIYFKDGTLYCTQDESDDCMHVRFALALPQVIKLKGKSAK